MKTHSTLYLILLLAILFLQSCGNSDSVENQSGEEKISEVIIEPTPKAYEANEQLFAWVDQLNLRGAPDRKAKIIASVGEREALTFTGDKSAQSETIVLRGMAYDASWLKVITANGTTGWVFGGAVKRQEENKGNAILSETKFEFPHFGKFDLSQWEKRSTQKEGEEVDRVITTYRKDEQTLKITQSERGEFGYWNTYELLDANKQLQKIREFAFEVDPKNVVTEKVTDYSSAPAKIFERSQELEKHYYQLSARPVMAYAPWSERRTDAKSKNATVNIRIQSFALEACSIVASNDSGCSCTFRPEKDNYKLDVLVSNLADNAQACIKLSDNIIALSGGRTDQRMELLNRSSNQSWITLNEKGKDLFFGEAVDVSNYDQNRDLLIQTLLVMDEMPDEIPVQKNGQIGMGHRAEIRSMCEEALQMAATARKNGDTGPPAEFHYQNDTYDVFITADIIGKNDGGGEKYQGKMVLKTKAGQLLDSSTVWGRCGC